MNQSNLKYHDVFMFLDQSKHTAAHFDAPSMLMQQKVPLSQGGHSPLDCMSGSENIRCASDIKLKFNVYNIVAAFGVEK